MKSPEIKLCCNCMFFLPPDGDITAPKRFPVCGRTSKIDLVYGGNSFEECWNVRYNLDKCGLEAQWYKPKE